jgi:LytS/YehU family sensor histidine kinase
MLKSGLIAGGVTFVLALGFTLLSPLCVPCLAFFLGLGAGYLAGVFEKPLDNGSSAKSGAVAGAIGGVGAIIGQMVGALLNAVIVGPEKAVKLVEQLGIPVATPNDFGAAYWVGIIGSGCCFGLLDVALMAGLGALGGLLWWQISGKQ